MNYIRAIIGALVLCNSQIFADQLYVANQESNTVSVVSTLTRSQVDVIDVLEDPFFVFVTPDQQQVWVIQVAHGQNSAQVIDINTRQVVATINPQDSGTYVNLAFSPDSKLAYLVNKNVNKVDVYNTDDFSLAWQFDTTVNVAEQLTITPDGKTGYLTNDSSTLVRFDNIDTNNPTATSIATSFTIFGSVITPDGESIYFNIGGFSASYAFGNLPIESASDLSQFSTGVEASAITSSVFPVGTESFYAGTELGYYQVDTTDNSLIDSNLRPAALFIALGSRNRFIYSTDAKRSDDVSIFDTATNTNTEIQIPVQSAPAGLVAFAEPETRFTGQSLRNRSVLQYELYNRLTWSNPLLVTWTPELYLIYRDAALTDLAYAEPASTGDRVFNDRNRTRGATYDYYLVAVDTTDTMHVLGMVSITSQ